MRVRMKELDIEERPWSAGEIAEQIQILESLEEQKRITPGK
jgi:hypothetical protein